MSFVPMFYTMLMAVLKILKNMIKNLEIANVGIRLHITDNSKALRIKSLKYCQNNVKKT